MTKRRKRLLQVGVPVLVVAAVVLSRVDFIPEKLDMVSAPGGKAGGVLPVTGIVAKVERTSSGIPVTGRLMANEEVALVS